MDEKQKRFVYENAVAVIVDDFLHHAEKTIKLDFNSNQSTPISELGNQLSGLAEFTISTNVTSFDELRKSILENSEKFGMNVPNEAQWKAIIKHFEVPSSTTTLENVGALDSFTMSGTALIGAGIGSVIPGIGTLVGGAVGIGIGLLRGLKKHGYRKSKNQEKIEVVRQNAIRHLREQRQRVIDAILAYSY